MPVVENKTKTYCNKSECGFNERKLSLAEKQCLTCLTLQDLVFSVLIQHMKSPGVKTCSGFILPRLQKEK